MEEADFAALVLAAVEGLPPEFKELMENVDVTVAEAPTARQQQNAGKRLLLGLYEGVPRTRRGAYYGLVVPDKITIFRRSIEQVAFGPDAVRRKVAEVVLHEIAHHFGLDDDELKKLKRGRRS